MAEDAQHYGIAKWLRAKGGMSGDGAKTGFHLQDWKDQGWEGEKVEFRTYKKDSWAQQAKKREEWGSGGYEPKKERWSGGNEPKEEPASRRNAADWSDWKATAAAGAAARAEERSGGGKGGGGGGSTGSGHSQPVRAPWHQAKEERASSSSGRGYEPQAERASSSGGRGYEPKARPPSSSDRRSPSTSNKIAKRETP
jgi:hypothetical protein